MYYEDGYEGFNNRVVYTSSVSTAKKEPIPIQTLVDNVAKEMIESMELGKNIIFIEPAVDIKMKQLMAIAGDKEIFGKLLIDREGNYLVVKDILIPDQSVTGASFKSDSEDIGKLMYSLFFKDNDPSTKLRRTQEEVETITKNMNGHFHSHNSVNSSSVPSHSSVDTEDMEDQVKDRDFHVEIIGSMKGYSGRIVLNKPTRLWGDLEVKIKWWTGIDKMLNEVNGKLNNTTFTYNTDKKENTRDKIEKELGDRIGKNELEEWVTYKCEDCGEFRYGSYLTKIDGKYLCYGCKWKLLDGEKKEGKEIVPLESGKSSSGGKAKTKGKSKKLEEKDSDFGVLVNADEDYCVECNKKIIDDQYEVVGADIYCEECIEKLWTEDVGGLAKVVMTEVDRKEW
jgi:hypothetical protein